MNLIDLLQVLKATPPDLEETEADTRARVIDPILNALGWLPSEIDREPYLGWKLQRGFSDYILSVRDKPGLVLECKRSGRTFDLPSSLKGMRRTYFSRVTAVANKDLLEALDQCLQYCQHSGAPYACATNGEDWIFFKPHHPQKALPDVEVIIFSGFESILHDLDTFTSLLGKEPLSRGSAESILVPRHLEVPSFARRLTDIFPLTPDPSVEAQDYGHTLDTLLKNFIEDIENDKDFEDCYVPVLVNRRTTSTIDAIITNQIHALAVQDQLGREGFTDTVAPEPELDLFDHPAGRLVVLHGPLGVGKSSFLRDCRINLLKSGKQIIWSQVDLIDFRDRPFDKTSSDEMLYLICKELDGSAAKSAQGLKGNYDPDEWKHLRDIYATEVRQFQKLRFPHSKDDDPVFTDKVREYTWELKQANPHDHLIRLLRWLSHQCRLPVIVVLDNSDQLGLEFQEFLYKIAESMQRKTSAVTILALRTEALASHRLQAHALATVHEQFEVKKAPLGVVLQRRFEAIRNKISAGKRTLKPQQKVTLDRLMALMDTLQKEAQVGSDSFVLLDAVGNESLRDSLRGVAAVFRSSPKKMDSIVAISASGKIARLDVRFIIQAIQKQGQLIHDPKPLIPNIFYSDSSIVFPYTLPVRVLQQVKAKGGGWNVYCCGSIWRSYSFRC